MPFDRAAVLVAEFPEFFQRDLGGYGLTGGYFLDPRCFDLLLLAQKDQSRGECRCSNQADGEGANRSSSCLR